MKSQRAYEFVPSVTEDKRIDVSIEQDEAVISLSDWVEGLGWSTQKTMRMDLEMLDELQRLVAAARIRMRRNSAESGEAVAPAKVLGFPKLS